MSEIEISTSRPSLKGKRVLVTGASGGIGRAIVQNLARDGAEIGIHCNSNRDAASALAIAIEQQGGHAKVLTADLESVNERDGLIQRFHTEFGGIDVLVNNAGGISEYKHFVDLDVESWEQAFSLNVTAPFALSKSSWSYFVAQEGGKIINISSAAVREGGSARGLHYVSAKAALEAMTVALAKEGASKNILVNAIRCGLIETDMHRRIEGYNEERYKKRVEMVPLGRPGRPEEVAALVAHLASEDGAFITGQVLTIAGGD